MKKQHFWTGNNIGAPQCDTGRGQRESGGPGYPHRPPPYPNNPQKQIYCKTNVFLMIPMLSSEAAGDPLPFF